MNLLQVRQWFVRESGRYELVTNTSTWADNGADAYINAGQKMLDRRVELRKSYGRYFSNILAGENVVTFQAARAINEVWTFAAGIARTKLEKKDMIWLRQQYNNMETQDFGTPRYWAPAILRLAPEEVMTTTVLDLDIISGYLDIQVDDHFAYNGVVLFPPTDLDITVEIWGMFYSQELTGDTSTSFWSVVHPELLVMAAQCVLEKFNRNSEGVRDWMAAIDNDLRDITFDFVEDELPEELVLGG